MPEVPRIGEAPEELEPGVSETPWFPGGEDGGGAEHRQERGKPGEGGLPVERERRVDDRRQAEPAQGAPRQPRYRKESRQAAERELPRARGGGEEGPRLRAGG